MNDVSKEYARALFDIAFHDGTQTQVHDSLHTMLTVMVDNPRYQELLASPALSSQERNSLLDRAFGSLTQSAVSFVKLLCDHNRINAFADCVREYTVLYDESIRTLIAHVTSAVALTEAEKTQLIAKLMKQSGKKVVADYHVDSTILGGIVVDMDGHVYDGSLKHRLVEMKGVMSR